MKLLLPMIVYTVTIAVNAHAQGGFLKKMANRAEQAATNKAGNAVEKGVNDASDKVLNAGKPAAGAASAPTASTPAAAPAPAPASRVEAYSKFDFVAGDQLLLSDDFSQDVVGEFAMHWNTNNKGEVVSMKDGTKWLKLFQQGVYLTPNKQVLPADHTIEFDMILDMHNTGYMYPEVFFTLFNSGEDAPQSNSVFKNMHGYNDIGIQLALGESNNTRTVLRTHAKGAETFRTNVQQLKLLEENYGKPFHVAISVQKTRFRMWINEQKVYDMPRIVESTFNQLAVSVSGSNYKEDQLGFYLSNLKIAGGSPDVRSKLLTEGKFSTTGITFDVNSDVIRPSSFGVIKEIGTALQSDVSFKVKITGHTDSDGSKAVNDALSLKRATAVKAMLTDTYKIAAERISVDGKGAAVPVAENTTPEGKAKNRRVEFEKEK
ncbi:OmpA family protein [Chitinophaga niabensis]|uniref:OmpA family protein n=1 Tax=Chitinophaga niabensis TaxID=536979 RepID=A0A1N6DKR5_9BACT|nr:OmpA family protein [Chitinophaga niabensis]SIN71419.1 OmpA family protein [Chitinophaga niabensis]